MRVIEHGDKYELGVITCDVCHCKFAYTKADIKVQRVKEYDTYDRDEYDIILFLVPNVK